MRLLTTLLILALAAPRPALGPAPIPEGTGYEHGGRSVPAPSVARARTPAVAPGSFPSPAPAPAGRGSASPTSMPGAPLRGYATWYAADGLIAAAGPALRKALGKGWRGTQVRVCSGRCVVVVLSDWCRCSDRHGVPTIIDLSDDAFRRLAPLPVGVLRVRVTVLGGIDLPETSTDG